MLEEPAAAPAAITGMTPPTVYLLGVDDLPTIPDFIRLGAVVVIAGDRATLDRWHGEERRSPTPGARPEAAGLVLDLEGRRVLCDGVPLPLSDLEFCVFGALVARPGRARSFGELRAAGWGDGLALTSDVEALRALIQRIRRKLALAGADVAIEPVRGFGYRAAVGAAPVPAGEPNGSPAGTGR
jgi:DNA-binding winged helix-turn-helix (wHTH) protein